MRLGGIPQVIEKPQRRSFERTADQIVTSVLAIAQIDFIGRVQCGCGYATGYAGRIERRSLGEFANAVGYSLGVLIIFVCAGSGAIVVCISNPFV